jgi:hypothetical protein
MAPLSCTVTSEQQSVRIIKRTIRSQMQAKAVQYLNPGSGSVSKLCHEPQVAVSVLMEMMAPYISAQKLVLLT